MLYLGANLKATSFGFDLPDGGLCALRDGEIEFAIAEERLSRQKKAGGFAHSLKHYMTRFGRTPDQIDLFAFSTCCDQVGATKPNVSVSPDRILYCPHHLSHALGSFAWSGFPESIVLVMDSGGDTFQEVRDGKWWNVAREQHSAFLVDRSNWRLIERTAEEPGAMGFGEFFRAVTYFLGWRGARYAGNTMALASLGDPSQFEGLRFFYEEESRVIFPFGNDPLGDVAGVVERFLEENGFGWVKRRHERDPFTQHHFDLAAWAQSELDRFIITTINRLTSMCGTKNVILSGGVAYNCVGVGRLKSSRPDLSVFVQPASGDAGQCVGNACYAHLSAEGSLPDLSHNSVSLGTRHRTRIRVSSLDKSNLLQFPDKSLTRAVSWLASGNVLLFFQGGSEYGPRALGYRSLLAAAHIPGSKRKLNRIKFRNYLMPVAPAILDEFRNDIFVCGSAKPFMVECVPLRESAKPQLIACEHGSGHCRIQTVDQARNPIFWRLLSKYNTATGVPVLFNTSLNGPGQPILETPAQTIDFLRSSSKFKIVAAWINGVFYYVDNPESLPSDMNIEKSGYSEYIDAASFDYRKLTRRLSVVFPDLSISTRERFLLYREFIDWVAQGGKSTTVRYKANSIECPTSAILPLYATDRFEGFDEERTPQVGSLRITRVDYKAFGDLDERDARHDGFEGLQELRTTLLEIYGRIDDFELVTIFTISLE
jgi:carbamoyltransferase